jgi:hypothetical protein
MSNAQHAAPVSLARRVARRMTSRTSIVIAVVVAIVAATTGLAFAYWSTSGSGTATASTGTLHEPTSVSAASTAGSGTAVVSWTASAGPLAPDGYYVARTNASHVTSAACNTNSTTLNAGTTCNDTSLAAGSYTYVVTAVYRSWTATSAASTAVTVTQASQAITFTSTAPANAVYAGSAYTVTATGGGSGNPVTFTIDASATSICSISGSTVSFTGVGTCKVNANQLGNANYIAAPQAQQSFTMGQASQTITYTSTAPANATVGGATYAVTATGGASGNSVTFTIDSTSTAICSISGATVSFTGVGSCTVDANQAGNTNYLAASQMQQSIAVGKGAQVITFTSTMPTSATVGGATYTVTATASSGLLVTLSLDIASSGCTLSGSTVAFTSAGTCKIDADQAGNANYLAAGQLQQSFAVAKANQTVTFTSTAPTAATVGGATYAVTATASSSLTVAFTSATPSICTVAGSTVSFVVAGTCTINANQAGNGSFNAAPQVQQSFAVRANQTVSFSSTAPGAATVGGTTYTVTATATSGLAAALTLDATSSGCSLSGSTSGSTVTFTAVGTCKINADQAGNGSFNAAPQSQQSFAVRANQTVSISSTAPGAATVGGTTYTVTATATSGLAAALTLDATSSGCSLSGSTSGSTVTFTAVGTCKINANQAGNGSFNAAPQVQQSFAVRANQSVSFTSSAPSAATVGGATYTVSATATSGLAVVLTLDATSTGCSLSGSTSGSTVTFTAAGTCKIDADQAGNGSFNAATQAQQSFGVTANALTITEAIRDAGNRKYDFAGTGGTSGATVNIKICTTNNFPSCTSAGIASATVLADGTWETGQDSANLNSNATYFVQAVQVAPSKTSAVFSFVTNF